MDKNDILDYVMNTPGNTNRAVLRSMLDSLGSEIEMVTLFDDDISGFTYTPSSQFGPATGRLDGTIIPVSTVEDGILKVTYEGAYKLTLLSNNSYHISFNESELGQNLPLTMFSIDSYYDPVDGSIIIMNGRKGQDAELEAYCQEPHHLKVEWFTI